MSADALIGLRGADPWPHETSQHQTLADDFIEAQHQFVRRLRTILLTAHREVMVLPTPPCGWPSRGYDRDSTLRALADMLPDQTDTEIEALAWEIAQEEM